MFFSLKACITKFFLMFGFKLDWTLEEEKKRKESTNAP